MQRKKTLIKKISPHKANHMGSERPSSNLRNIEKSIVSFTSELYDPDASLDMGSSMEEVPHNIAIKTSAFTEESDSAS